ncbi:uncharacterized protein LOC141631120 [Silene latifolia]|uniref:uncharacterized protein LOC141631120 n=1 Tax=Silene latifolia TaxID=37657 RepID=UPI003D77BDA0
METTHYDSWAELFLNTAQAFEVGDHISAARDDDSSTSDDESVPDLKQWTRLDAIVKQWIFTTISQDLLLTILQPGAMAKILWDRIHDIFRDNKHTRAVSLEHQFSMTKIENFATASAYCQALKTLADQLANFGSPVTNDRLVLQLVAGLNDGYKGVATIIQHSDPLPLFYKARSMLILEETSNNPPPASDTALVALNQPDSPSPKDSSRQSNNNRNKNNRGNGKKGKNKDNRNNKNRQASDDKSSKTTAAVSWTPRMAWYPYGPWVPAPWASPWCPYPTSGWSPQQPASSAGILGPRPPQAFMAYPYSNQAPPSINYTPTDLGNSFQGMTLMPPDDRWFMDTGASSHMASDSGNLSSYATLGLNCDIVVGSGQRIPITGQGHTTLPSPFSALRLQNVLHVPHIVKNLVSVRRFTTNNSVSVEFDPLGFSVKDLKTGKPLLICNSKGDLYPLHKSSPTTTPHALLSAETSQQVGIDCDETFSPVVKPTTIRTAPQAWYHRFATFVATIGFRHSTCDNSLFIYTKGKSTAYLLLYVDDIVITTSSNALLQDIMARLKSEFAMTDLGPLSYFLGVAATRDKSGLFLHQSKYAADIIQRANMSSCKSAQTPVDTKAKLSAASGPPVADASLYKSLVGALQYLTFTCPNIAYVVQQICLFMHDPREEHWSALKRITRYVKGTTSLGLHIGPSSTSTITTYTDADCGGCPDTRRSTSGYCVFLGDNLISWSSKRQPTLSRSSAEAEYRGVANIVAESCWVRNLLLELNRPIRKATIVYCDNVSAIYLSGNPVNHQRTKHIEMDIHFVREKVALGEAIIRHVPSRYQYPDVFTKGLPK